MSFQDFFNQHKGLPVEVEDPTALDQCMDLAFAWCDALGIPHAVIRHAYAYQVFTQPTPDTLQHFDLIVNTPDGIPLQGDLVVFGTVVGSSGHICIANGTGDAYSFESFDQNWNGHSYCETVTHTYNGVLGWLHPKSQQAMGQVTQAELDQIRADRDKNWTLYQGALSQITTLQGELTAKQQEINELNATITNLQQEIALKPTEPPVPSGEPQTTPPASPDLTMALKTCEADRQVLNTHILSLQATINKVKAYANDSTWFSWIFVQQQVKDAVSQAGV